MAERLTEEKVKQLCQEGGLDCSQIVFAHGAEVMGLLDKDEAYKIGACFGGGMMNGETCGCVTGALMALGLKQGHTMGEFDAKEAVLALKTEFENAFREQNGSLLCRDIIGLDFSKPEDLEKIMTTDVLWKTCPKLIADTCELLEEFI